MTVRDALIRHFLRYRKMKPQDAVKLCYQSEFGGGHLITDKSAALARIEVERAHTAFDNNAPIIEHIGDGICRLNFAALPGTLSSETICEMFIKSAAEIKGSEARFERKLNEITALISEKYAPFSLYEYMKYIESYYSDEAKSGAGAVHHSIQYSSEYHPSYRIISAKYVPFIDLFAELDRKVNRGEPFLIRIDGRCGSGKTTLAGILVELYGCGVAHTDDFYIPHELRTKLSGSVDYERLSRELSQLPEKSAVYAVYNCSEGDFIGSVKVSPTPFCVLEGSFSMHPQISIPCDMSVFLTIPPEIQLERIEARCRASCGSSDEAEHDAEMKINAFKEKWIPAEEAYFNQYDIERKCDFVINTAN